MGKVGSKKLLYKKRAEKMLGLRASRKNEPKASSSHATPPHSPLPSTSSDPIPSTPSDYFEEIAHDFREDDQDLKEETVSVFVKREILIEEVMKKEGIEKQITGSIPSRHMILQKDILDTMFSDHIMTCSNKVNGKECLGKLEIIYEDNCGNISAIVRCKVCNYEKIYQPKCLDEGQEFTDYNMSLVYISFEDGRGYVGYNRVCASRGHKALSKRCYYNIKNYIGSKIFQMHADKDVLLYRCLVFHYESLGRLPDDFGILDIDVSFYGSWLTRGHKSHIGLGAVIDVHTGLIIDFHVCSNYCVLCKKNALKRAKNKITEDKYKNLMEAHKNSCNKNIDEGLSSGAMEAEAAKIMWGRSLVHKLRYVNFIGDGDSSAYNKVCAMNDNKGPYDNVKVSKQECVNHVGKLFGSKLRKLRDDMFVWQKDKHGKQYKKKLFSGKNKLTENVINHLSFYFGVAVKKCTNKTVKDLKDMIMAIFYHCGSTDESPKHQLCPKDKDSYCFYNRALALKKKPQSHKEMKIYFRLDGDERKAVLQVFRDMCSDNFLQRCLMGKTRNPNESLHSKIWNRLSKVKFFGLLTVQQSVCLTVLQHNWGFAESYPLAKTAFGSTTASLKQYLEFRDKDRKRHSLESSVGSRKKSKKKEKVEQDPDYGPGAH